MPKRLYRAWLAEAKTPWFSSYLVNQPELVRRILIEEPSRFPKSDLQARVLGDLLGRSVFVTNGEEWERQRRLIDPAFSDARPRKLFDPMLAAGKSMIDRLEAREGGVEMEFETSHAAADVIFRTLFSTPIEGSVASEVFDAFRAYQLSAPMVTPADILRLPKWMARLSRRRRQQRRQADRIRTLLAELVAARAAEIAAGTAPDDLATALMTARDPKTGARFDAAEMLDQVGIFFLAGHETSASALAWALYLMATHPDIQHRVHRETAQVFSADPAFSDLRHLPFTRDVFRETLRLYPPVPMMIREASEATEMRGKSVAPGAPVILSPWYLGRHERLWDEPHVFDPDRWQRSETREPGRTAYLPFSAGPRVCPGAGFAMQEGVILLALLASRFHFEPIVEKTPRPMMHLTVRSENGIWLRITSRGA